MTDAELRDLYGRIAKIRSEMGDPHDHHEVCAIIYELGNVPIKRVHEVCLEVEA